MSLLNSSLTLMLRAHERAQQVPGVPEFEKELLHVGKRLTHEVGVRLGAAPDADDDDAVARKIEEGFDKADAIEAKRDEARQERMSQNGTQPVDPQTRLSDLLHKAMHQEYGESEQLLLTSILTQLVPDEARLLAAMSDGHAFPLVNVVSVTRTGRIDRTMIENLTGVGRAAGVKSPEFVPVYIGRLLNLKLIEISDEDTSLREEYDILTSEQAVRELKENNSSAKIQKRSVKMSDFGRSMWAACQPATAETFSTKKSPTD